MSAFDRNAGGGPVAQAGESVRLAWRPEHTFVIPVTGVVAPTPSVREEA
jgi:hypothetical protein